VVASPGGVVAVGADHKAMGRSEGALEDIVVVEDSTLAAAAAIVTGAARTGCDRVDHGQKVTRPMLESSIVGYGRRLEGMGASSERPP